MVTPEKNVIVTNKDLNITSSLGNIFMQGNFGAKKDKIHITFLCEYRCSEWGGSSDCPGAESKSSI